MSVELYWNDTDRRKLIAVRVEAETVMEMSSSIGA